MDEDEVQIKYATQEPRGKTSSRVLDISSGTIVKFLFSFTMLYLVFLVRDILIWFVFALVISILFNPAINFLMKLRIPRMLASVLIYLGVFCLLGSFIFILSPLLFSELQQLSENLPTYFEQVTPYFSGLRIEALKDFQTFSQSIGQMLSGASTNIFVAMGTVFGGIFSSIAIFSIAFFLSLEEEGIAKTLMLAFPKKYKTKVLTVWGRSQRKIAAWFGVRIICCFFIGLIVTITCFVLGVKYAVFFGLFAGIFNIIISIGPFLSGATISLFIFSIAGLPKAIIFLIAFLVAQQIEGSIIMPLLSKKFLNLSPSLVLMSLLVGVKLWGLMGAILIIPLVGIFFELVKGFLENKQAAELVEQDSF
ncbi:MAG: AI-2E family transporter [Patescibacteria group bacterium]|nr:AI-2E family transporter [Patescibacteria group bacterium]